MSKQKTLNHTYKELSNFALEAICNLADKLGCTPKKAKELYLKHEAKTQTKTSK